MRTLILLLLFLPLVGFADEARIAVGQSYDEAVATIKTHSGKDITPDLAVVSPKGEHPLKGIYWEFRDYDTIITLAVKNGEVAGMSFWSKKDFRESKSHRAKTERSVTALVLNTKTKGVSIEKTPKGVSNRMHRTPR